MYKFLGLDVDGVLTNGSIAYTDVGDEFKIFNAHDGLGLNLCVRSGILVAIITGRNSNMIYRRAEDLGIKEVWVGIRNKKRIVEELLYNYNIKKEEAVFIGDDILDIPALESVGFPVAVRNACKEVKEISKYITNVNGGDGAVREVCELILKENGVWRKTVNELLKELRAADY
ncbi:MAG TPA: HAD-IIIA family hydrolase [candidate division WOR-3 bacterium]|uniref:3-deoxy-D-manno-octulosonate 8-phosphate phosphatase KdsC n=1 Tax=candidate division WOR-3 bacterium TaxID=2052148 RepID=A0A7C5DB41_UNCW3|nr:HAD-IIIA family hydrolase [candidate division WOR-3 bacterium]